MSRPRFFSARLRSDPYGTYASIRALDGLHRTPIGPWVASRLDDVRTLLMTRTTSTSTWTLAAEPDDGPRRIFGPTRSGPAQRLAERVGTYLPFTDPPDQVRLRQALAGPLRAQLTKRLPGVVRAVVRDVVDGLPPDEPIEVVSAFARLIPQRVGAALLGLDEDEAAAAAGPTTDLGRSLSPLLRPDRAEALNRSVEALEALVEGLVERRRRQPGDDLVSDLLLSAELTDEELRSLLVFTLAASQETTAALLASAVHLLADHPNALAAARRRRRWDQVVEEALRLESPVQLTMRRLTGPVVLGGTDLPAGAQVIGVLGAANRDQGAFDQPDAFRPGRGGPRHVAFGAGSHACPGAPIAHLQGEAALAALFERFRRVEVVEEPVWADSIVMRAMDSLVVRFGR